MNKDYLIDLGERVFFTWVEAFLGLLLVMAVKPEILSDISVWQTAAIAAVPAALAVLKGGLAKFAGDPESAGFVAPKE